MFTEEDFLEVGLNVVILPADRTLYFGYLQELPTITAEGNSRGEVLQKLGMIYAAYRARLLEENEQEEKTLALSMEELLRYYDGETFDGFLWQPEE